MSEQQAEQQPTQEAMTHAPAAVPAKVTTATLVHMALDKAAPPETLERLMALHERWEANEARKAFVKAMARFKAACPSVLRRDARVAYSGTSYTHATLGHIIDTVTPHLSKNGLSVGWRTEQGKEAVKVTCRLTHEAGHFEEVSLAGPPDDSGRKNRIQQIGSSMTYLERYTVLAVLGLSTADQDDADQPRPRQQAQQQRPKGSHDERVEKTIKAFAVYTLAQDDLEAHAGDYESGEVVPAADWREEHFERFTATLKTIKAAPAEERQAKICELFQLPPSALEG